MTVNYIVTSGETTSTHEKPMIDYPSISRFRI